MQNEKKIVVSDYDQKKIKIVNSLCTVLGIIADECAIGVINNKTTAVRLIPAIGKKAGDTLNFGGLLGYAPIMPVNQHAGTVFAHRGGRFPAPINSLKN